MADLKHSKMCSRCVSGNHGPRVMKWRQEHLIWENLSAGRTFLVVQTVKHLPTMRETWVLSLGLEDPLEEEMATHCSILAWRILLTEEPGGLLSMGSHRVRHD